MPLFSQSAFMEALGWSLVDSFWKMGSLWLAYLIFSGNGKRFSASTRYSLALALMTVGSIWSAASVAGYYSDLIAGKEIAPTSFYFTNNIGSLAFAGWMMPYVSSAYLAVVALLSVKLFYQYNLGKRSLGKNLQQADPGMTDILNSLAVRTGVRQNVGLFLSEFVDTPLTVGFLKPMILLPVAAFNQLSTEETEAVLAHELFHIRHNDYLINILVTISGTLFFFNPFARMFQSVIERERELVCDDEVMSLGFDRWQYAHALYTLGKTNTAGDTFFAMAATGQKPLLLERVRRILKVKSAAAPGSRFTELVKPVTLFFLCLFAAIFLKAPFKMQAANENKRPAPMSETSDIAPAIYRQEMVVIERKTSRTSRRHVVRQKKNATATITLRSALVDISIPAVPEPPPAPEAIASYVSMARQIQEFTLSVPQAPVPPEIKMVLDGSVPYVPSSTFYYSIVADSLQAPGRKTVHL